MPVRSPTKLYFETSTQTTYSCTAKHHHSSNQTVERSDQEIQDIVGRFERRIKGNVEYWRDYLSWVEWQVYRAHNPRNPDQEPSFSRGG